MKKSYYIFVTEKPIKICKDCPCCDLGTDYLAWCQDLKDQVDPYKRSLKCRLIRIEGKVEQ